MIAIGIDLGTTNSCASVRTMSGKKMIILFEDGKNTMPSAVCFSGEVPVVGTSAKRQAVLYPNETCLSIKRLIGKCDKNGKRLTVNIKGKEYKPEVISSMILKAIIKAAEKFLGEKVDSAVITVPAYFESDEREATKEAGEIAGIKVLRIMNEPTAAALAYGLGTNNEGTNTKKNILVYDLGGGTFDVTTLCLEDQVGEVKSTNGNRNLGGDDFDNAIIEWITEKFVQENKINLTEFKNNAIAKQRMREAAEIAKIELSGMLETSISLPMLFSDTKTGTGYNFNAILTRAKFDFLTKKLVESTKQPTLDALRDAGWTVNDVDEVVMVGGSIRIPAIKDLVANIFGENKLNFSINPDEVVAEGAGIQAAMLTGVTSAEKGLVLLDVLPLSLGIEEHGRTLSVILPRNTTIPTEKTEVYSTVYDNQTSVDIKVYQGERALAADNKLLGSFLLHISPAPRGVPEIAVKFEVDANGILNVSATDKKTGKTEKLTIQKSNLTKEEINQAIEDSKLNEAKDKAIKLLTQRKARIEILLYEATNAKDKIIAEKHEEIDNLCKEINELLNNDEELKNISEEELNKKYVEITKKILELKEKFPVNEENKINEENKTQQENLDNSKEEINEQNVTIN